MSKLKLVKRSENVNYNYSDEGEKTPTLNSVSYKIVDEESGNEIGSADCHNGNLNVNIYGGINSIKDATETVEKMFSELNE